MKNQLTPQQILSMEESIIKEIKFGYSQCKTFFQTYTNKDYEIHTKEKKKFLKHLCETFYNKFREHTSLYPINDVEKVIEKYFFVPLIFKNGGFEYPRSFSTFMDRIKDVNVVPAKIPDLSTIDNYIRSFPESLGLDQFLEGFFKRIKRIIINLRRREEMVLKLITNPEFLRLKKQGKFRITPPSDLDVLEGLKLEKNQLKKIERAINLLLKLNICNHSGIIMNSSKFGFYYALTDTKEKNPSNEKSFWEIKYSHYTSEVHCIPSGNVEEFFKEKDYIPLTNWYWNTNFNEYDSKNSNPWIDFQIPNFLADTLYIERFNNWILNESIKKDFKVWEINIIKSLSRITNITISSLEELSSEVDVKRIITFLEQMVEKEVFQYYPIVNFIGLDYKVYFRFKCENKKLFANVLNGLLMFPIVHIFTNDQLGEGIGYIHLPRHTLSNFFDNIEDFKERHTSLTFDYSTTSHYRVNRCLNITGMDIEIKNGITYIS